MHSFTHYHIGVDREACREDYFDLILFAKMNASLLTLRSNKEISYH